MRDLLPEDKQAAFEMDSDKDVHTYLGNKPITAIEQAAHYIGMIRQQYIDNGIGRWAVVEKATGNFVGWSGLKLIKEPINGHTGHLDLGYRFLKQHWNKGYATETALASLGYGFEELKHSHIYAIAHVDNIGSQNVIRKCGLQFVEQFDYGGMPHNWYSISQEEWKHNLLSKVR